MNGPNRHLPLLDDEGFRTLLDHLQRPWKGYRRVRKGVMKRIRRHMRECRCSSVKEYLTLLEADADAYHHCQEHLRVTISRFFRDRALWRRLRSYVIPDLLAQDHEVVRIWSAGCACGEEPYSFAILWDQLGSPARCEILATDDDPVCLQRAARGGYGPSSLKELGAEMIDRYFQTSEGNGSIIAPRLGKSICWQQHNLLQPPPEGPFQIIFLRNTLLTYYRQPIVGTVMAAVVEQLQPGGFLVIGCHEQLPDTTANLTRDREISYLFRKYEF